MRILIIGQAPPAVKQTVPYDTTLLYDMLGWVGITKEQAQGMFEFEAVSNKFPGKGKSGHLKPSIEDMEEHFIFLKPKIREAERVIILGNVAQEFLRHKSVLSSEKRVLLLIHPSKLNYSRIMKNKDSITQQLKDFLTQPTI